MEVQGINVVNLGDSVAMVMFKTHGEERSLEDGSSHVQIKVRIKWNEFGRLGSGRKSDTGLHRHV